MQATRSKKKREAWIYWSCQDHVSDTNFLLIPLCAYAHELNLRDNLNSK
jgi:hypothetical protein